MPPEDIPPARRKLASPPPRGSGLGVGATVTFPQH
jgi:hypothetical protein